MKRILFWLGFIVVLGFIIWGLIVALQKPVNGTSAGAPSPISTIDHVKGPENAPVTIIEFSDFQCPACEAYYSLVSKIVNDYPDTVRLVYRHFPLPQHPNAIPAAMASEAASAQGKFWEMYDLLFSNHADWTELADPTDVFIGYAGKIGLNVEQFKQDISSSTLKARVQANADEAVKIGVNYTPSFFVNGKIINNPQSYEEFKAIIEKAAKGSAN
ncbi:MAG: DsbA family protein [Patescibacteria group bacterium]|nr:DsbA family protein [Patescibacteria group bacterium]